MEPNTMYINEKPTALLIPLEFQFDSLIMKSILTCM